MKKRFFLLITLCATMCLPSLAKEKEEVTLFEEAYARKIEPQSKIYVRPQSCDLEYLSRPAPDKDPVREKLGPYPFKFKGELTEVFLENAKNRALFQACKERNADMMVGVLFDSYVKDSDPSVLYVEMLAYPVKFVDFKSLGDSPTDFEMIRSAYPSALTNGK